ncbi:hypothetical protein N7508_008136 [Penicillium antarcticum]|uniref:uncharacterized protein n=1 Tax=Penicillium antarcticum TaxID=416450 RepID=UPI0023A670AE|nr:uncharacterized protein N7508_008136 [Penicillium antarcticum]KAJ5297887.1 hypothetical protein N7508_008136 [Penicillium antarcticum]
MAESPLFPPSECTGCPYDGYYAASNGTHQDPTHSPNDAALPEDVNDSEYIDFNGELGLVQQHTPRAEENALDLDPHHDPVTADSNLGPWVTPNSSRSGSVDDRVHEDGNLIDSITTGQPWVGPWTGLSMNEINENVPDVVTAPSGSTSDNDDGAPRQELNSAIGSASQFQVSSRAHPPAGHRSQIFHHSVAPTDLQVVPQAIQHAPFQGVRQSTTQPIQNSAHSAQFVRRGIPKPEIQVYPQVIEQVPFQGFQHSFVQGVHEIIPPSTMQTESQLIHQPIPVSVPQGLSEGLMQVKRQYMSPVTSVTSHKTVHRPDSTNNPRPAKRQAREPHTNYSPPVTQLENARGLIAQLVADKKAIQQKLDKFTVINPNTGKAYVENLKSENAVLQFGKLALAQGDANHQTPVDNNQEKYHDLLLQYNALITHCRASEDQALLWRHRYLELSAILYQPIEIDTEMSMDFL